MTSWDGPEFRFVEEVSWDELRAQGGFRARETPLLVKGAVSEWPASTRWTFDRLAELRRRDGSDVVTSFQNGLVEQGETRPPLMLPIAPYLRGLADSAADVSTRVDEIGLLPGPKRRALARDASFRLDWSYLQSFVPDRAYLAQWNILGEFPELRDDFAIPALWPGWRWTWEYTFIGPANTITGIHYDFPNNWFCQVTGTKEFLLFPPDQTPYMSKSRKYDWGATLSDIDISKLDAPSDRRALFEQAKGYYTRVEAGDALFVPARTWHSVVSLAPSISLAVFGLTAWEILAGGGPSELRSLLHKMRLYRWGECTCHANPNTATAEPSAT